MERKVITSSKAPAAVGPYSQAVAAAGFVFTAGQLGLDPATGKLAGDDVKIQAERALDNLDALLKAAGASFGSVVKATVFLKDLADFPIVNAAYKERFTGDFPARSTIQVARLPMDALVEIEMVALTGAGER